MARFYFDASALVKRYTNEDGTTLINELFHRASVQRLTCTTLGVLEIVSVLVRKKNDGRLSAPFFAQAMLEFNQEVVENDAFAITTIDDSLMVAALSLIDRHNLNATDAIILKSCLGLEAELSDDRVVLCTSDKRLARAAKAEGLSVFDPEVDTLAHLEDLLHR